MALNVAKWFSNAMYVLSSGMLLKIYGCFLFGFFLGRARFHERLAQHRPVLRRVAVAGLAIGLPLNVVYAFTIDSDGPWGTLSAALGIVPLSAAYASIVALVWLRVRGPTILAPFASVGRMALTNYVGQSAFAVAIYYGPGLGLGGKVGPTLFLPIALAMYLLQVWLSNAWLRRFQFGPLEWIWRMLTYGRWYPLRKPASGPPANRGDAPEERQPTTPP